MLPFIYKHLPASDITGLPLPCARYFEPLVGGGAMFFDYGWQANQALLNDLNKPLMDAYRCLKDYFTALEIGVKDDADRSYNDLRAYFNAERKANTENPLVLGPLFVMLNHLCFNGLWRENKSGGFNVPRGTQGSGPNERPRSLATIDWDHLKLAGERLQSAQLAHGDCLIAWPWEALPGLGDVVSYDPPYAGEFSNYDAKAFTLDHHRALRDQAQRGADNGATVIVCGSNNEWSWKIYGKPTEVVSVRRTVGASLRGDATEALYVFAAHK
jgi:DNA adenine methylase